MVHLEESRKTRTNPVTATKSNDEQIDAAAALMHESKEKKKKNFRRNTNYCSAGKHNPDSAHDADHCWQLHPELRPGHPSKPSTQLAEEKSNLKISTGGHSNFLNAEALCHFNKGLGLRGRNQCGQQNPAPGIIKEQPSRTL
ncbi:uncharacterized protein VP01_884g2 [Puccinia sorghi]|uniref:Uncharacterized protein n=1 Tax=Puccinia sorghi TaxID=27349 RepID=A0A0L6U898_9BASI|nr:uncharacterized protein VP01_884g2 [Puccinia sorghi]